jgi:hypothetical protein
MTSARAAHHTEFARGPNLGCLFRRNSEGYATTERRMTNRLGDPTTANRQR